MSRVFRPLPLALALCFVPALAAAQNNWVNFSPSGGTVSSATLNLTIQACSEDANLVGMPSIGLNGALVNGSFTQDGNATGCPYQGGKYVGTLTLVEGTNYLSVEGYDFLDNPVNGYTTFNYQPPTPPPSGPHYVAYADKFRDVGRCVASCFAATAAYTTPTYTSLDVARGATLLYRSDRARPVGYVAIDANDPSPGNVVSYSIKLRKPDNSFVTFLGSSQEVFFAKASSGPTRLAVQFDASSLASEAYAYTAVVRTHYSSGPSSENTLAARVMIVNGSASPYGAGWDVAQMQRAYVQSDGVMIASGDGSVSFFDGCSGTCQLTSPGGDFSTLHRLSGGAYKRRYPDGTEYHFSSTGELSQILHPLGQSVSFAHSSGAVQSITDQILKTITFTYSSGKLTSIMTPGISTSRTSYFTVDGNGDLTVATDPDGTTSFAATYNNHRIGTLTDRRTGHWNPSYGARWYFDYWTDGSLRNVQAPLIAAGLPNTRLSQPWRATLEAVVGGGGSSSSPISASLERRAYIKNPRDDSTFYAVNRWGSPTQTDYPIGPSSKAEYDATTGVATRTVSSTGDTTTYTWTGPNVTQIQHVTTGRTISTSYESSYNRVTSVSGHTASQTLSYPDSRTTSAQMGSHPVT